MTRIFSSIMHRFKSCFQNLIVCIHDIFVWCEAEGIAYQQGHNYHLYRIYVLCFSQFYSVIILMQSCGFCRWSHKHSVLDMAWPLVQISFGWLKSLWFCAFQSPTLLGRYLIHFLATMPAVENPYGKPMADVSLILNGCRSWIIFWVTVNQHCFDVHNLRHLFQSMEKR
jgi:hypothetical protein